MGTGNRMKRFRFCVHTIISQNLKNVGISQYNPIYFVHHVRVLFRENHTRFVFMNTAKWARHSIVLRKRLKSSESLIIMSSYITRYRGKN